MVGIHIGDQDLPITIDRSVIKMRLEAECELVCACPESS